NPLLELIITTLLRQHPFQRFSSSTQRQTRFPQTLMHSNNGNWQITQMAIAPTTQHGNLTKSHQSRRTGMANLANGYRMLRQRVGKQAPIQGMRNLEHL